MLLVHRDGISKKYITSILKWSLNAITNKVPLSHADAFSSEMYRTEALHAPYMLTRNPP